MYKIGETTIGNHDFYQLIIHEDQYEFIFNNQNICIPRQVEQQTAEYYLLFPYFGLENKAPHDINIEIKMIG